MEPDKNLHNFLYRRRRYRGQVKPEALVFNANLQDFAQRISYITDLETAGKISPQEAYYQINGLWEQIRSSYCALGIENKDLVGSNDWCI
ncbi:MAG TPA: hypothetical protein DCE56_17965 [Cyanobacteria bacterium UBA8553]|nr:hypothetical protein [Cyanobacteria bacterium UBA8553]HAJ64518.1 hypothetical protein [Cyanobacteria bacterium UBA8543]